MWQWLRNWLLRPTNEMPVSNRRMSPLNVMAHADNSATLTVVPIRNGFLLCNTNYNPNGPDKVEATFASGVSELHDALVVQLTAARLKL